MLKLLSRQNSRQNLQHSLLRMGQRCFLQRLCVAWLLGTVLWSSSVAVAAAAMGCCNQPQACCTMGAALSCATCVPPLSALSAQPSAIPVSAAPSTVSPYFVQTLTLAYGDIWRPPKTFAA